jgi:Rieske 2Fe-2S family protein
MWPGSSVSGIYLAHPESYYFGVAKVERDQVEDYAAAQGHGGMREVERWLGPMLNYGKPVRSRRCPRNGGGVIVSTGDHWASRPGKVSRQSERTAPKDPDFYRLDLELIWYRDWLFVGHDCELAKPGSFFTVQVGDYPVVLVRDQKGELRAFHNSCRHRGSRVCTTDKGTAAKLVCPYHQWTYELDGRLLFARQMAEGFDKSQFGLKPVACESVGGYIFICLADEPADFAPMRAMVEPYLLPHRLREAKVAFESTIVEKGNWKLVWENNRECYHCAGNHPELCKTFPEAPNVTGVNGAESDPEMLAHWAKCEAVGLPSKFRIDAGGQYRATRAPLLRDAVSYTMSGKRAVRKNLSDSVSADRIGTLLLYHYPTTWNHVLGDHAVTFRVLPISATETAVTTKWLVTRMPSKASTTTWPN